MSRLPAVTVEHWGRIARGIGWAVLAVTALVLLAWAFLHLWIVPRINDYRPWIVERLQQATGQRIAIERIEASSTGWVPSFEVQQLRLLDDQGQSRLTVPKAEVALSLSALLRGGLERLEVTAPQLTVTRNRQGRWLMGDWLLPEPTGTDSALLDWLFSQREVVVHAAHLSWIDEASSKEPLQLSPTELTLYNGARKHRFALHTTVASPSHGTVADGLSLQGEFRSPLLSIHVGRVRDWQGQLHIHAPQWQIKALAPWLPTGFKGNAGQGRMQLWLDWAERRWQGGAVDLDVRDLALRTPAPSLAAEASKGDEGWALTQLKLRGQMRVLRLHDQAHPTSVTSLHAMRSYRIDVQDLLAQAPGTAPAQAGALSLQVDDSQDAWPLAGQVSAERVDAGLLRQVLQKLPLPAQSQTWLQQAPTRAYVETLRLQWQGRWPDLHKYQTEGLIRNIDWPALASAGAGSYPSAASAPTNSGSLGRPGVENARLAWKAHEQGGHADLRVEQGSLSWPGVWQDPRLPLDALTAALDWRRAGAEWQVDDGQLSLRNPDLNARFQGRWRGGSASVPLPGILQLQGQVQKLRLDRLARYWPRAVVPAVRHYLDQALLGGEAQNVQVLMQGPIARWPYAQDKEGRFAVQGQLSDVTLAYLPTALQSAGVNGHWPDLAQLQGQLRWQGDALRITDIQAQARSWPELRVAPAEMSITQLVSEPHLQVQAQLAGPAASWLRALTPSPLLAAHAQALDLMQVDGLLSSSLRVETPLKQSEHVHIHGEAQLLGNTVRPGPQWPALQQLRGRVSWNERGLEWPNLQAQLLGGPVQAQGRFVVAKSADPPELNMQFQGLLNAQGLREAQATEAENLPVLRLANKLDGSTRYAGYARTSQGKLELELQSDLQGLAMDWPAPLNKPAHVAWPLLLQQRLQTTPPDAGKAALHDVVRLQLGDAVQVAYERNVAQEQPEVLRGVIDIREASSSRDADPDRAMAWPERGVEARVALDRFSVDAWRGLLAPMTPETAKEKTEAEARVERRGAEDQFRSYLPSRMQVQARELVWEGRTLHEAKAQLRRDALLWSADLQAQELQGRLQFHEAQGDQSASVMLRLQRLSLPPQGVKEVETLLEQKAAKVPALDVEIEQLQLRGKDLGRLELKAAYQSAALVPSAASGAPLSPSPSPSVPASPHPHWVLHTFNLSTPESRFKAQGQWQPGADADGAPQTQLQFEFEVDDAGALLSRLGQADMLKRGQGRLQGQVGWQGSPLAPHVPSLSGQVQLQMHDGQFLKIDPGAARLLGVLSLQSLPRRLLLNFRDVFSDGFSFDQITGAAQIEQGVARSQDLHMRSLVAQVHLKGEADIVRETQNLRVRVDPEVDAGAASVVAGFLVNPLTGLISYLAQKVIGRSIEQSNMRFYEITGSWLQPDVKEIKAAEAAKTWASEGPTAPSPAASASDAARLPDPMGEPRS